MRYEQVITTAKFIPDAESRISTSAIVSARPAKNPVDPRRPYAFHVEPERGADGRVDAVATLFLTNRECPLHCLMCDLWRNTTDDRVPLGAIPAQIDYALSQLPPARHIKLYNSGNFFDPQAIPPEDFGEIARRVRGFRTVVVENHPRFCGDSCWRFCEMIETELEVAVGLETIHSPTLERLNKQMTVDDFDRAVENLLSHGVAVRAFILLRPPGQNEDEGIEWALRSIEHAFARGVRCCSVIPVRGGNGILEQLAASGQYTPPRLASLERVLEQALRSIQQLSPEANRFGPAGHTASLSPSNQARSSTAAEDRTRARQSTTHLRVFADVWDLQRFSTCGTCFTARARRLHAMNLSQTVIPKITCACGS